MYYEHNRYTVRNKEINNYVIYNVIILLSESMAINTVMENMNGIMCYFYYNMLLYDL